MSKKILTIIFSLLLIFFFIGCSNEDKTGSFDDGNDYWEGPNGPPPWLDNGGNNSTPLIPLEPATPIPTDTSILEYRGIWTYTLDNKYFYDIEIWDYTNEYAGKYYFGVRNKCYETIEYKIYYDYSADIGVYIKVDDIDYVSKENDVYILNIKIKKDGDRERCEFRFNPDGKSGTITLSDGTVIEMKKYRYTYKKQGINELLAGKWYLFDNNKEDPSKYITINKDDGSINLLNYADTWHSEISFSANKIQTEAKNKKTTYKMDYHKGQYNSPQYQSFHYEVYDFKYDEVKRRTILKIKIKVEKYQYYKTDTHIFIKVSDKNY